MGNVRAPFKVGQIYGHSFQEPPEDPNSRSWTKGPLADHLCIVIKLRY